MGNSASGAQVVRKPSESSASLVKPRPSVAKSPPGPAPRWSGSIHELAASKQRKRAASQPTRPDADPPTPAAPKILDPPAVSLSVSPAEPSPRWPWFRVRRWWNSDRRWQLPCWLTSFVLHLLAIVVLGSLTVPVSRQRTVVALLLSLGEADAPSDNGPDELATTISLAALDAGALPVSDAQVKSEDELFPAAPAEAPIVQPVLPLNHSPGRSAEAVPQAPQGLSAAEPPGRTAAGEAVIPPGIIDTANKAHEEVVSRFIEFDVGRLRGPEGLKAKQNFDRLGTEALASLIRGLNKSAKMQASCPVLVISQKVGTMLRENPHPALVRYALANIGREVPTNATHIGHLQSLVNQLRQLDLSHSWPNVPMLLASLKSRDLQGAIQAANVVTAEHGKLVDFEKCEVAWALIQLLTHRSAELRAAAHTALIALAEGADHGPASDRHPADRLAAACRWSLELCPERFEAEADKALNMADKLTREGKGEAARRFYRKLVHEYAGTTAAAEAAERLKQPAELASR